MPINMESLNAGVRFPYPLPKEGDIKKKKGAEDEWVLIRSLSVTKIQEIDEQTTERKERFVQPNKPNGKLDRRAALQRIEFREVTDQALRNRLMWDEIIGEIHIFDSKETLIPSTLEMKEKLMSESPDFALYVAECLEILTEDEKDRKKELEKNS